MWSVYRIELLLTISLTIQCLKIILRRVSVPMWFSYYSVVKIILCRESVCGVCREESSYYLLQYFSYYLVVKIILRRESVFGVCRKESICYLLLLLLFTV